MSRVLVAIVIVVVAAAIAAVVQRRRTPDAPTQRPGNVPDQLDRADFPRPDAAWLVAVFTSDRCESCRSVLDKAVVLESDEVAIVDVEFTQNRSLHDRYRIDAVPTVAIVDSRGVTRASFLGPMTATDLWAAVAEVRDPGTTPFDIRPGDARDPSEGQE
jgi:hypothetical protein